jgi:hypothetical protein
MHNPAGAGYNRGDVRSFAKTCVPRILLLALAVSGVGLAAAAPDLPGSLESGWVLADLNGDHNVDLATARSGLHDASGYAQEVRVTLGAFRQTSFNFQSSTATVELSTRDVDGDDDGDLIVFEPLSSQPIAVWLNDGAGTFHEARLADFEKLWSEHPGSTWRVRITALAMLAISDERTQTTISTAAMTAPEPIATKGIRQSEPAHRDARRSNFRPRAPPCNS